MGPNIAQVLLRVQKKYMARFWHVEDPTQMVAVSERHQAQRLLSFDHHRVLVDGCWGILITYPWMLLEEAQEPLLAKVLFNPVPDYMASEDQVRWVVQKHPEAPEEIQTLINLLLFRVPD
jgi:hypothetical protein